MRVKQMGRLHFHTHTKASLHTCELSYCCVIVNWQESQRGVIGLCNVSLSRLHTNEQVHTHMLWVERFQLCVCTCLF